MSVAMERGSHTLEEEASHGYAGIFLLSLIFSFGALQSYTGLETWKNILLFLAIWLPIIYFGAKWMFRDTPQMKAKREEDRLDWLQKQAKGAKIYAEQMREQGDEEAAEKADAAAAEANAELEEIATALGEKKEEAKKAR
mmetsp:Transcript_8107/g.26089  ORF Transcript_8107/g.26089 Transcript_8107/m.26089 type:complete len:140 (-) Transcript_8107:2257-2676(-)